MKAKILALSTILFLTACTLNQSYRESSDSEDNASNCEKIDTAGGNDIYMCKFGVRICYVADGFEAVAIDCIP